MLLRILMNVQNQLFEVSIAGYFDPAKGSLKQCARALISPVERAGVSVEEIGELFGGVSVKTRQVFDPNQKMKMILQQAIGKSFGNRLNVMRVEFEKVDVVAFFNKNILAVVAAIVDVVILARLKRYRI